MNEFVQQDQFGGEYMIKEGKEMIALWLPLSLEEKTKLIEKAQKEKKSISQMVTIFLKHWLENKDSK